VPLLTFTVIYLDYGNYGGGNGGGNSYGGHMMVPPPRPAPSADGWSSGENQYDVYDRQQQQQQHHHHQQQAGQEYMAAQQAAAAYAASQAAFNPQWNIGASEFVPKYDFISSVLVLLLFKLVNRQKSFFL